MTTTTIPATWPTEEIYEEAGKALANGYNHVEAIMYELGLILDPYMDGGKAPDVLPTAETVEAHVVFPGAAPHRGCSAPAERGRAREQPSADGFDATG
jgi:hypothetical protein